jgi:hypothetical protein
VSRSTPADRPPREAETNQVGGLPAQHQPRFQSRQRVDLVKQCKGLRSHPVPRQSDIQPKPEQRDT